MMWQKWNENVFKEIKDQCKILIGKNLVDVQSLSHVLLFETPWIAALHASMSMRFFRQEY